MGEEDDDEEEGGAAKDKVEENDKMREKMKQLRSKMENMTVTKKVCSIYFKINYFLSNIMRNTTYLFTLINAVGVY